MSTPFPKYFNRQYQTHLKHMALKGLQPKTIDAYSRAIRRIGAYFDFQLEQLTEQQLLEYFSALLKSHSWSAVKHDLYALKFFYRHVLHKPWTHIELVKPPKAQQLPDILTVEQLQLILNATDKLTYRVFFFTLYSMGLRLGETIQLKTADIDADRRRVHVRNAKGNRDRLVPLPDNTLTVLRQFWAVHRNPTWLFPNRRGGLTHAMRATSPLHRAGVQKALQQVALEQGIKKRSAPTA